MISKFSVKKPYTVLVGVILVIVLGIVSFTKMSADLLPDINLPYVVIMTTYVGASPETVETVVTAPIEASMATVSNIEGITSMSSENYSVVILEFSQKANMDSVSLDIRESLDQLESYWDDSVGSPVIMKLNPNMLPAMIAAVGVEGMDEAEVSTFAQEKIIPRIEAIEGVASVSATGLVENSVQVVIREDKIAAINARVAELIDEKFEEAYEKIADARSEIEDGEAELDKAEKEVKKGEKKIKNAQKELANSKDALNATKESTINELSNAKLQLMAAKSELEAAKITCTTNIQTADSLYKAYTQLVQAESAVTMAWTTLDGAASRSFYFTTVENAMDGFQLGMVTAADLETLKNSLIDGTSPTSLLLSDVVRNNIKKIDFTQPGAKAEYDTIITEYYAEMATNFVAVPAQRANVENQLVALTGGKTEAEVKAYKSIQQSALYTVENNLFALDAKILELYEGESKALVEFANGLSQIELAEYQLGLSKNEITSGKSEITSGKDQLKDARDKLDESEADLENQKAEAKEKADLTDVLSVDTVKGLLTAQNFSMPAGYVEEGEDSILVRIGDKPDDLETLGKIPLFLVPMSEDEIIYLADVTDIFTTDNTDEVYTNVNGKTGVVLSIQKQTGFSTGDVADALNERFEELREEYSDMSLITLMDQGVYIDLVMDTIVENVLVGALLAILILIAFLRDIRPTIIIAISIPISMIAAIVCMYFSGVTLNIISLSGLALGVGMLVDNSIVVIENIYRMRNEGRELKEAAIEGAKEVAGAIAASTLTTICVFLPIVFTDGITRQLFVDMGLTIAYSLLASLAVALTVVPALAAGMLKKVKKAKQKKESGFYNGYRKFLSACLTVKPLVLLLAIALLAASIYAVIQNGTAYFPAMESTQITVSVGQKDEEKEADVLAATDKMVERLMTLSDVIDVGAMASSNTLSLLGGGSTSADEITSTTIYVTTTEKRELSSDELVKTIKDMGADLENIRISVETATMDMTALGGSGISFEIKGRDIDTLYELADKAAAIMATVEGVGKIADIRDKAELEFRITVDKDKAIQKGLTVAQVFQQIYPHLSATSSATKLSTVSEDISVFVSSESDETITIDLLKAMPITYTDSEGNSAEIALSEIASFKDAFGMTTIRRSGQTRYISVSASLAEGYNIGLVSTDVEEAVGKMELPKGYSLEFTGENEMIVDALKQLSLMLVLAVIFIYLIMVAQFQSLSSPFIIMFTIPLAFTGGFAALYFTGNELSIIAMIGLVMLSGIIVNNGIVLVDYINQRRECGLSKREAILESGVTRLRPVLMTALTTILALMTMAFSTQMGADMTRPLAIVVIGGMVYGTLMTLIVVPCIYDLFVREKKQKFPDDEFVFMLEDDPSSMPVVEAPVVSKPAPVKKPEKKQAETETRSSANPYMMNWHE